MSVDWTKLQEIFDEGTGLDENARARLLNERCGNNPALRSEVEKMLRTHDAERLAQAGASGRQAIRHRRFGPWETVELLGRGGMAEVWLARRADGRHEQRAALKLLSPYLATPDYIERFHRERQFLARLEHPHIARLLDGGVSDDGEPYLVMEYIAGRPLDQYCEERRLPIRERVELLRTLCGAVESAHRNLVLHRDIKPSNVLVTSEGDLKLVDFGAAGAVDSGMRTTAPVTPAFASPEQIRQEPVTTVSDVYGLGATMYRVLAGIAPFGAENPYLAVRAMLESEAPSPSEAPGLSAETRREIRGDLDNIVRKAMDKDPNRRYPSAERLSADLGRYLDKRPVQARPITWTYRAERFVARNRLGVALASLLLVVLAAGSVALAWQVRQVKEESRRNAKLTEFLTRVIGLSYGGESSPVRAYGRNTRILDVIRYVDDRLATEMAGEPQLEARLRAGTGRVLIELGYLDEGERSLLRGLRLVDKGRDPALFGELTTNLARLHMLQGAWKGAEPEAREGLRLVESAGAKAPLEVRMFATWNLADILLGTRPSSPDWERLVHRTVDLGAQIGTRSPAYALAIYERAALHLRKGQLPEAERDLRESMQIQKGMPLLGVEYYSGLSGLGIIRVAEGKAREGIPLIEEGQRAYANVLGENSSLVQNLRYADVRARLALADQEITEGHFDEARSELSNVIALAEKLEQDLPRVLPKARVMWAAVLSLHGAALRRMGQDADGKALIVRARDLVAKELGTDSSPYRSTTALLAAPAHILPASKSSRNE